MKRYWTLFVVLALPVFAQAEVLSPYVVFDNNGHFGSLKMAFSEDGNTLYTVGFYPDSVGVVNIQGRQFPAAKGFEPRNLSIVNNDAFVYSRNVNNGTLIKVDPQGDVDVLLEEYRVDSPKFGYNRDEERLNGKTQFFYLEQGKVVREEDHWSPVIRRSTGSHYGRYHYVLSGASETLDDLLLIRDILSEKILVKSNKPVTRPMIAGEAEQSLLYYDDQHLILWDFIEDKVLHKLPMPAEPARLAIKDNVYHYFTDDNLKKFAVVDDEIVELNHCRFENTYFVEDFPDNRAFWGALDNPAYLLTHEYEQDDVLTHIYRWRESGCEKIASFPYMGFNKVNPTKPIVAQTHGFVSFQLIRFADDELESE